VTTAKQALDNVSAMDAVELAEIEVILESLSRKVLIEKSEGAPIGDLNDYAFLKPMAAAKAKPVSQKPKIAVKPDWYQNGSHLFLTYRVDSANEATVKSI
jgi:hypothetical protein